MVSASVVYFELGPDALPVKLRIIDVVSEATNPTLGPRMEATTPHDRCSRRFGSVYSSILENVPKASGVTFITLTLITIIPTQQLTLPLPGTRLRP